MEKYKGIIILLIVAAGLILMIPASIVIYSMCVVASCKLQHGCSV